MYIKPSTNEIFENHAEIRAAHKNVSFPHDISDGLLLEFGIFAVAAGTVPAYDPKTHTIEKTTPAFNSGTNQWEQQYLVRTYTQEETSEIAANIRGQRDELLSRTDWRFRSDLTPSQAWKDYCQALRNLPQQPGFPHDVTWPTKPE